MTWKDNTIMYWGANKISDHGRSALNVVTERIERKERMIDGTMRRYLVGTKETFSCSWDNIPSIAHATSGPVDGGISGAAMKAFADAAEDPFTLTLSDGQGNDVAYQVYLDSFSYDVNKRGSVVDLWNVEVTLVEV